MSSWKRNAAGLIAGTFLLFPSTIIAQQQPAKPFGPDWGMFAGWKVFSEKGCGKCHAVRGVGGGVGPDLGRIQTGKSFFELGAAMWSHLPRMGAKMREAGVERPTLTPTEMSNLIAFLFTVQYFDELGNSKEGEKLFASNGCIHCHEVGGKGGHVGPGLDFLKGANSPVLVAAAMWNHGPEMSEAMKAKGITRPTFQRKELVDLIAYIVAVAKDSGGQTSQVVPGTPDRGQQHFSSKRCVVCHAVGGKGGSVGPDLGRGHHVSLTEFAALMWNHGPAMWEKMKARGIQVPRLTGQEMADIIAYLYTSRYFDQPALGRVQGQQLLQSKGCLSCHSVRGKGGKIGADFATSKFVASPAAVLAGMWNHSRYMEAQAQRKEITWPNLTGQELADISAYLVTIPRTVPLRSTPK